MKTRTTVLRVEVLEDRCTPATFGNPWPDAEHLTLSFVPDGTKVGDHSSNLFQALNAIAPTKTWETEILRAFQTWAVQGNINVTVVADDGSPLGTAGAIQSDARFGDIRIAGWAGPAGAEGVATPYETDAGTWSGDVQLNTGTPFSIGGGAGTYDLYSVAVHEAGHVFGLDHNPDSSNVMFDQYDGVRAGLGAGDVMGIQNLYGSRAPDLFEGTTGNDQLSTATRLNPLANGDGSLGMTVNADITTLHDKDVFSFGTLLNLGAVDITVRTAGNSLLAPHAIVYDAAGRIVAQAISTDPLQGGFIIHLTNVRPLSTYLVQIESGRQDVFGIGSYQLSVHELGLINNLLGGLNATVTYGLNAVSNVLINNDLHTNDSFATATPLPAMAAGPNGTYVESARGGISDPWDVDFYRLQTPSDIAGDVLTATVWGLQNQLDARVRVFDAQHNLVAAQVINNDGFTYTVEIAGAAPQAVYYIEVVAANPSGASSVGNYFVDLQFSSKSVILQDFTTGTLDSDHDTAVNSLTVNEPQIFHFVLSADANGVTTSAAVQMTITDANGKVVAKLLAPTSEAVTSNVFLNDGTYTVTFTIVAAPGGTTVPPMTFRLRGDALTDEIGPDATDPTGDPESAPAPTPPPPYTWSGDGSTGVASQDPTPPPGPSSGTGTTNNNTSSSASTNNSSP